MYEDFWHRRWSRNEIAFHQQQVNPYLQRYVARLQTQGLDAASRRVFVPLCGKTLDMLWLAEQGFSVLGVELSEAAVQAFFAEHQLQPQIRQHKEFISYKAGTVEIWCGDFFQLEAADLSDCGLVYDRAALIALPEAMRQDYVAHLSACLPASCRGLLISLEYPQEQMAGPPFSVSELEVQKLFQPFQWHLELLERPDVSSQHPRFHTHQLDFLHEPVYWLRRS